MAQLSFTLPTVGNANSTEDPLVRTALSDLKDFCNNLVTSNDAFPAGILSPYAGTTAPTGWLLCDGTAVSRSTYAALFTAISTSFGSGNGSTTFNVPDLRGRVPVGLDNLGGSDASRLDVSNTLGGSGGTQTHTLTTAEMPAHTHRTFLSSGASASADYTRAQRGNQNDTSQYQPVDSNTQDSAGGGGAHNNMQPYLLIGYIIKY